LAKAVRIAIGGQAHLRAAVEHRLSKRRQIGLQDIRAGAVEQNVAIGADRNCADAMCRQEAIKITGAAPVQGIAHDFELSLADGVEIDQLG